MFCSINNLINKLLAAKYALYKFENNFNTTSIYIFSDECLSPATLLLLILKFVLKYATFRRKLKKQGNKK